MTIRGLVDGTIPIPESMLSGHRTHSTVAAIIEREYPNCNSAVTVHTHGTILVFWHRNERGQLIRDHRPPPLPRGEEIRLKRLALS